MFQDKLKITLKLTVGGTPVSIPGAQVKRLSVDMKWWGFEGEVEFWLSDETNYGGPDTLLPLWKKLDIVEVYLGVEPFIIEVGEEAPAPLALKGIGTEKRLHERTFTQVGEAPALFRRYTLKFADAAAVLWKQHFPSVLYTDTAAKMKDIFDAHKGAKIRVSYDDTWAALTTQLPQVFIGLGDPRNEASFWDYVVAWTKKNGGVFTYESDLDEIQLTPTKAEYDQGTALPYADVESLEVVLPESPRHDVHVLNSFVNSANDTEITQAEAKAVTGIRHDLLMTTEIQADVDGRVTIETARLVHPKPEVRIAFKNYPTVTFRTGTYLVFSESRWSTSLYCKTLSYRVRELSLRLSALNQEPLHRQLEATNGYSGEMTAVLEDTTDLLVRFPPHKTPRTPSYLEGKVLSEEGDKPQETVQFYNSAKQYKIEIPLYASQKVVCDLNPNTLPGHFFFPAYKGERVLVAFAHDKVWIKRFLEWRAGARPPDDAQGNQLLMGKKDKDNFSILHKYVDSKPVFSWTRRFDKAIEYLEIKEGSLKLHTEKEK